MRRAHVCRRSRSAGALRRGRRVRRGRTVRRWPCLRRCTTARTVTGRGAMSAAIAAVLAGGVHRRRPASPRAMPLRGVSGRRCREAWRTGSAVTAGVGSGRRGPPFPGSVRSRSSFPGADPGASGCSAVPRRHLRACQPRRPISPHRAALRPSFGRWPVRWARYGGRALTAGRSRPARNLGCRGVPAPVVDDADESAHERVRWAQQDQERRRGVPGGASRSPTPVTLRLPGVAGSPV